MSVAGWLMLAVVLGGPLLVDAGMKIGCGLLFWQSFGNVKPPEAGHGLPHAQS